MTRLSEKRDVQDALINHVIGIGWEYLPPNEIKDLRSLGDFGGLSPERERFLVPIARQQLIALNPSTSLPSAMLGTGRAGPGLVIPENVDHVLRRLRGVHPSIAGSEDFLHYLRGHSQLQFQRERLSFHGCYSSPAARLTARSKSLLLGLV